MLCNKYIWTSCKMCYLIAVAKCVIQCVLWPCSRRCVLLHLHGDVGHLLHQRHQHPCRNQWHWGWTEPYHCCLCRCLQPRRNRWSVRCCPLCYYDLYLTSPIELVDLLLSWCFAKSAKNGCHKYIEQLDIPLYILCWNVFFYDKKYKGIFLSDSLCGNVLSRCHTAIVIYSYLNYYDRLIGF